MRVPVIDDAVQWRRPARSRAVGCSTALLLAVAIIALALLGLDRWLNPAPVRVRTVPAALRPWPPPLDVVAERKVIGSPSVSSETAPPVERMYVLLRGEGLDARQVATLASQHLDELGWNMEPDDESGPWWFASVSRGSPNGEEAYVGTLDEYLESGYWAGDDGDAPDELRRLAGAEQARMAVVQVIARG